uniref:CHCH domain-containing protein n=1 Tax=Hyaloperonospora arabidopsidis (strain Emoy2) TaxID=559515 RepID=M4BWI2_HYAAE
MSSAASKPPVPVLGLHAGSKSNFGEDLDVDELIERNRCHEDYYKLEDCLADFDRDWRKCQKQVKKLKQCNDRVNQLRQAHEAVAKSSSR